MHNACEYLENIFGIFSPKEVILAGINSLKMFLNKDEIIQKGLIENAIENQYGTASYNLTVGRIIDMDGKSFCEFKLKPQGMIYVIFNEKINLPNCVTGFAHVKTALTRRGIMATNIGIIDPLYKGYLSTLLINFGSTEFFISKGETALRVTFSNIIAPNKPVPQKEQDYRTYLNDTQSKTDFLDEKFLNLNNVEKEVSKVLITRFFGILAIFGAGSFLLAMYFQFKASRFGDTERAIKRYETQLNILQEQNRTLEQRLERIRVVIENTPDTSETATSDSAQGE